MISIKYPKNIVVNIDWGVPPYKIYLNGKLIADNVLTPTYEIDYINYANLPIVTNNILIEDGYGNKRKENFLNDKKYRGQVKEIIKREYIWNKHYSGELVFLFKRRKFGIPCNNCYDEEYNTAADSNCPVCYGTKYVGGYYPPIPMFGILVQDALLEQQSTVQPLQVIKQPWILSPTIVAQQDDLIYSPITGNKLYRVTGTNLQEYHGFLIKQEVSSVELGADHITYNLVDGMFLSKETIDDYRFSMDRAKYLNPSINIDDELLDLLEIKVTNISIETGFYYYVIDNNIAYIPVGDTYETPELVLNREVKYGFVISSMNDDLSNFTIEYSTDSGITWQAYSGIINQTGLYNIKIRFTNNGAIGEEIKIPFVVYK